MLITQSSWLLTLSPNCQITIPKSFQTHTFALRRGNLPSYLPSPFQGAQRYEVFCFVKPPSILHPTSRQGGQRYEVFDIHKYRLAPPPPCHFSKIKSDLPIKLTPLLSAPPLASPFSGSAKVRSFSLCQVPSIFHPTSRQGAQRYEVFRSVKSFPLAPPLLPSLRGATKLRTFWHLQASLLSKTHSPLRGERKGTKFFALSSPPSIPPRFLLGSAKVLKMRQLGFAACCG